MSHAAKTTVIPPSVMDAAAAWLARRDKGFSSREQTQFEAWRTADPTHSAAIARLERSWAAMDRPLQNGLAHDVLHALAIKARRRKRRRVSVAVASLLVVFLAGSLWTLPQRPEAPASVTVLAPARQVLPDGTVVELKDSASIAVEFTAAQRRVTLHRGTAHFQVTKDSSRPFTVFASDVEVSAVGTAFTVDHQALRVEVLVTEGLVAVVPAKVPNLTPVGPEAAKSAIMVSVGEVVEVGVAASKQTAPVTTVGPSEIAERLAWRTPRLEFTGTPLAEAVRRMNEYNRVKFVVDDPLLTQVQVSGLFRADRADGFVQALETGFGVVAERRGENEIGLRRAR